MEFIKQILFGKKNKRQRMLNLHFSCFLLDLKSVTQLLAEFSSTSMLHVEPININKWEIEQLLSKTIKLNFSRQSKVVTLAIVYCKTI